MRASASTTTTLLFRVLIITGIVNGETNPKWWNGDIACTNACVIADTQTITITGIDHYNMLARKLIN